MPTTEKRPAAKSAPHDCFDHAVPYRDSGGALGHGWVCGVCGKLLQVG